MIEIENNYRIFPNPAQNELLIQNDFEPVQGNTKISIYNLYGSKVLEYSPSQGSKLIKLNISDLPASIYFCNFNSRISKRFVIVR